MKSSSSTLTVVIIAMVLGYFLSPPLVIKVLDSTPLKGGQGFRDIVRIFYFPVIQLGENCPPYRHLLNREAKLLGTDL